MGDNIYLGDRNGVRTPMQWTMDRNAGFSKADAAQLYAPVIVDPVYSYNHLNVEAENRGRRRCWLSRIFPGLPSRARCTWKSSMAGRPRSRSAT